MPKRFKFSLKINERKLFKDRWQTSTCQQKVGNQFGKVIEYKRVVQELLLVSCHLHSNSNKA